MSKQLYIYEAGSLTYLQQHNLFNIATDWRDKLDIWAKDNGVLTFNPAKTFLIEQNCNYSGLMAVKQNEFYLDKTNLMIVQLDYIDFSPGTIFEIATYKQLYPYKPIIAFGKTHWSPHIMSCISQVCSDIDEVIELLCNMFEQNNMN